MIPLEAIMAKTAPVKDTRLYQCPVCHETWQRIGDQCGQCGCFCTEARVRDAEAKAETAAVLAAGGQPPLEGLA